jgi:hypothetical protein
MLECDAIASFPLPEEGEFSHALVKTSAYLLKGVQIRGNSLEICDRRELISSIRNYFPKEEGKLRVHGVRPIGNDGKYELIKKIGSKINSNIGNDAGELIEAFIQFLEKSDGKRINEALNEKVTTLSMLKANFYYHGKLFGGVREGLVPKESEVGVQIFSIIGLGLSFLSNSSLGYHYLLLPENIGEMIMEKVVNGYKRVKEVLSNRLLLEAPWPVKILKVSCELVLNNMKGELVYEDLVYGYLYTMQIGQRATILSAEPLVTEGLVKLLSWLSSNGGEHYVKDLSMVSSLTSHIIGEVMGGIFASFINDILLYSRTGSLFSLYKAISTIRRTSKAVGERGEHSIKVVSIYNKEFKVNEEISEVLDHVAKGLSKLIRE